MNFYEKKYKRIVVIDRKADSNFWDSHWDKENLSTMMTRGGSRIVNKFTKRFLKKGSRILEGGCGTGKNVYNLNKLGYDCYGVDFAKKTVERIKHYFPNLKVSEQDLNHLCFPDNYFSGYWSLGVIEHNFTGYEDMIKEASRVLKPAGYLFLSFPHMSLLRKIKAHFGCYPNFNGENGFYEFILDDNQVEKCVKNQGFSLISQHSLDAVKGIKDEISILRPFLRLLYKNRSLFARGTRYIISTFFAFLVGHSKLMIFQKNDIKN